MLNIIKINKARKLILVFISQRFNVFMTPLSNEN